MATLTINWDYRVTINGRELALMQPSTAPTITLATAYELERTLATATTLVLWDATAAGQPSSFDFLYVLTSQDCYLEFTCNNADANERVFALPTKAGIPFVLGRDDAYYNFTAGPAGDVYAGSLDVIDYLRIRNVSGTTANLSVVIGKT